MKQSLKDPMFIPGHGWEVDLDESTCTPETLARLGAPDHEQKMDLSDWKKLYAQGQTYYQLHPRKQSQS